MDDMPRTRGSTITASERGRDSAYESRERTFMTDLSDRDLSTSMKRERTFVSTLSGVSTPGGRKKDPELDREKARMYWKLLRDSMKMGIEAVKKADLKTVAIQHGMHPVRKLNHDEFIRHVIYNKNTQEYLSVDMESIHVFHVDGRKKYSVYLDEQVDRLLYCSKVDQYVTWTAGEDEFKLLNAEFEFLSCAQSPYQIKCLVYNENTNEVVTAGVGHIMCWCFRYCNRYLIQRKVVTEELTSQDVFTHLALEDTASRQQRCYAVCGTAVAVFNLYQGQMLCYRRDLHARNITSLLFFNPLKNLITASKDGSVKVWDDNWGLRMVFVGHTGAITDLVVYPYGPFIISSSQDCTIRVWSLETCDEVDKIDTEEEVAGLGSIIKQDHVFSYCSYHVDLWRTQHIHNLFTTMGSKVKSIKYTEHKGQLPPRAICVCEDSAVRIIAPATGNVLTTVLLDSNRTIVDAVYAEAEETMFVALDHGDLVKAFTTNNPCTIKDVFHPNARGEWYNCLCIYEYVVNPAIQYVTWMKTLKADSEGILALRPKRSIVPSTTYTNRTIVLGGRKDGHIAALDWETGLPYFKTDAHGMRGVISMVANYKENQIISAGRDNVVKVWRIFPFSEEALSPLMSFYCAQPPLYMATLKERLCVGFQEPATATYSVVMYNLVEKNRFDHRPDDDHIDDITSLACCPRMKVFASSSLDGTVKIWNEENSLIRIIKLNVAPHSVAFCSQRGDLLVGIGKHLHRIEYNHYMPKTYIFRMVSMQFPEPFQEEPISFNNEHLNQLNQRDIKRLKNAHSSLFRFDHFMDILSVEEEEELHREEREKEQVYAVLKARDNELLKIKSGELTRQKKPKLNKKKVKSVAFKKYLDLFYRKTHDIKVKDPDDFDPDTYFLDPPEPEEEPYMPERGPLGFFPPATAAVKSLPSTPVTTIALDREKKISREPTGIESLPEKPTEEDVEEVKEEKKEEEEEEKEEKPPMTYVINPSGFIPNSILVRLLWPAEEMEKQKKKQTEWKPPTLTAEQLAQIDGNRTKPESVETEFSDEAKSWSDEEEEPTPMLSKLMEKAKKPPTPEPSPEPSPEPPPPPKPKREIKPRQPIKKMVTRPLTPPKPPTPSPPPPPREPTPAPPSPPRPLTPLPDFISQFDGTDWYKQFFSDPKSISKPWTMQSYLNNLLRVLKIADWPQKAGIVDAITLLHSQENFTNIADIVKVIMDFLGGPPAPNVRDPRERPFVESALKLLNALRIQSKEFVLELMALYLENDSELRLLVHKILGDIGMQDPHRYFYREMDTWTVAGETHSMLKNMAEGWLDTWTGKFKVHLQATIDQLRSGGVQGMTRLPTRPGRKGKGILKKTPDEVPRRRLSVTIDAPPDQSAIEHAQPIEAVNYFCELVREEELARMRKAQEKVPTPQPEGAKNTVLVLPHIPSKGSLLRLGETHTSKCHRHRETGLADVTLPPILPKRNLVEGFTPFLSFPTKKITMNPFPSPADWYYEELQQPILITLKMAPKYFVHELSYLHE
ncbi:WD repeat-containing protein 97-like isoform X2 [Branchiostoma lanceolatum]|uniref:WD repeat-containing protein 97-like isoform X2 n=1 Tax=Branchiostoma lanceolatum TaxID=7740 RepID=UPI00345587DE